VVYGLDAYNNPTSDIAKEFDEQQEELKQIVERTNTLMTGGSDVHSREDFEKFINNEYYADKTVGLLDNLLENSAKKLSWYKS
jgi:signal transduction histidine kinase